MQISYEQNRLYSFRGVGFARYPLIWEARLRSGEILHPRDDLCWQDIAERDDVVYWGLVWAQGQAGLDLAQYRYVVNDVPLAIGNTDANGIATHSPPFSGPLSFRRRMIADPDTGAIATLLAEVRVGETRLTVRRIPRFEILLGAEPEAETGEETKLPEKPTRGYQDRPEKLLE